MGVHKQNLTQFVTIFFETTVITKSTREYGIIDQERIYEKQ